MSSEEPLSTSDPAKTIKAINTDTVHKICSGQVVLSLAIAVKELVENAIDAGATTVEVKIREYGLESIEVVDNGSGVEEHNFEGLTAKYHTSKLREFNDLETVATFGFRGEALSSLCALSDMKIVTKHDSVDVATKLELNNRGEIIKRTPCARQTGTTVTLTNLFGSLPVRKREFQRNIQKEFAKMCQMLQGYGLIAYGKRIILTNHTAKGGKSVIMSTNGSHSLMENIVAIFGSKQGANLLKIRPPIEQNEILTQEVLKSLDSSINVSDEDLERLGLDQFAFDGFVSSCSHGCGRSARDRQYFFINGRPCDPKSISKVVNEVYHRYNQNQNPFIVLNIILERRDVDVNVTPDKRQVMVNNETILRLALKKSLLTTFGHVPSTFKMETTQKISNLFSAQQSSKIESNQSAATDNASDVSSISDDLEQQQTYAEKPNANKFASMLSQWRRMTGKTDEPGSQKAMKRKNSSLDEVQAKTFKMKKIHEYLSEMIPQDVDPVVSYKSESDSDDNENENVEAKPDIAKSALDCTNDEDDDFLKSSQSFVEENILNSPKVTSNVNSKQDYRIDCKVKAIDTPNRSLRFNTYTPDKLSKPQETSRNIFETLKQFDPESSNNPNRSIEKTDQSDSIVENKQKDEEEDKEEEVLLDNDLNGLTSGSQPKKVATLTASIEEIRLLMEKEVELADKEAESSKANRMKFKAKIDPKDNKSAEQELKTEISKSDFIRMEILGQFNLGFIIVRLNEDLFVIDQHATDEKYNFETLQKTTVLQHQPLVVPQDLDITAVNELILMDNLKVFEANGFKFDVDMSRPVTKRVKLIGKPFSRNWEFGKEDIDELLFMLQEGTSDAAYLDTCRPSRVRAMFASRACRSSVMIGTALSKTDMRRLVDHMGTIEQPWNCPHGRPTIRHLVNLQMLSIHDAEPSDSDKNHAS